MPDVHLTPYREIRSVPPGQFVKLRGGKTTIRTYWTFNTKLRIRCKSDVEYEEQYRHLFRQAVRRRLRTDSPILADLSGGLDSSSIVCMADDILAREGARTPRVDTFSFYDSTEPVDDDLHYFTKVEERRGKTGFHVDLQSSGDSLSFEHPVFVASPWPENRIEVKAALSDILRQHPYRVSLSGHGGDDVNGQALDPCVLMTDLLLQFRLLDFAKQLTVWSLCFRKRPWIHLFFQTLLQFMPVSLQLRLTEEGKVSPWINHRFAKKYWESAQPLNAGRGFWHPSVRNAVQGIVAQSRSLAIQEPSIIERRYPYFDQSLVEFLRTIPLNQLLRPGQRRFLMRSALRNLLPPEVLARKTKAGITRGHSLVFQKHWDKVESVFSSPLSSHLGYVDEIRFRESLIAMKHGQLPRDPAGLVRALSLELWLRSAQNHGVISIPRSATPASRWKINSSNKLEINRIDYSR